MFCSNCGKSVPDGARFCTSCGAPQEVAVQPQPQPQPVQPQPQPQQAPGVIRLYMDAKGLTLLNYKFDIRDAAGVLRYRAATVTESAFTYNARIYYADDSEAVAIHQQKKMTMAAMNFDLFRPDGSLISEVLQKVHFTSSEFQLPQLGLVVTGDFFSLNFAFKCGEQVVAKVTKKVVAWGDCYELEFADPQLEQVLLATIMVIQMVIAASRNRRRRH